MSPISTVLLAACMSCSVATVQGHGNIIFPPSRNAQDRHLPEYRNGRYPPTTTGCNCGGPTGCMVGSREGGGGQPCLWFSQGCTTGCSSCDGLTQHTMGKNLCANATVAPTLPREAWTMNRWVVEGSVNDTYAAHPWRAPGRAPVVDACGMAGGALKHGGGEAVFGDLPWAKQGDLGSKVLKPSKVFNVSWESGKVYEVSWGLRYNHGGGYSYRLCKASEELTEQCFQKTPLDFTQEQSLRWNDGTEVGIKGVFVTEGTTPAGSMWSRNPIPRIDFDSHSSGQPAGWAGCSMNHSGGTPFPAPSKTSAGCRQFDPPCEEADPAWRQLNGSGFWGDVEGLCSGDARGVQIVDKVIIPKGLTPGHYVLGFRWDCEETAQIWSSCSDITITA